MSLTQTGTLKAESAAYGGFVDAAGGIATVVLAIVGLAHTAPELMISIATIVFGAALLIQAGAMLSEYAEIMSPVSASAEEFGGGSMSGLFLAGAAGIVLGILSVLGLNPSVLTSCAIIAFGAAMLLAANSVWHLHRAKRAAQATAQVATTPGEILANDMAFGSASVQALAGITAIVLGIIALSGGNATILPLVALLVLGGTLIVAGTSLSTTVMGFMKPVPSETAARTEP
jgi:hypothetical protein